MRTYGQFCGIARALDVIGDRWTLLIVRELLIRDRCRWTDLKRGLPGIATNLLADRLRELERNGIIASERANPASAAAVFCLTDRGRELEPALHAIGQWGAALLRESSGHSFQSHWLTLPLRVNLRDLRPHEPPATLELRTGDQPLLIELAGGNVAIRIDAADHPDALLSGPPETMLALLIGGMSLDDATQRGARYLGDPRLLDRLRPAATPHTGSPDGPRG
jgi:DNA-binding HxlR family transcriptional regulator